MTTYTYSIYDADPQSCTGTDWPGHSHAQLEAEDLTGAIEQVEQIMADGSYYDADGYEVGQTIYSHIWEDGRLVAYPAYKLTSEDIT